MRSAVERALKVGSIKSDAVLAYFLRAARTCLGIGGVQTGSARQREPRQLIERSQVVRRCIHREGSLASWYGRKHALKGPETS